jgi:hypothetical protein
MLQTPEEAHDLRCKYCTEEVILVTKTMTEVE